VSSSDPSGTVRGTERLSLVTKVAKLYHESQMRQPEIADRLNISQSRVSRLLKQAVAEGIVRTVVIPPRGIYSDLEVAVSEKYDLIDTVICESLATDEASLLNALGSAGGEYLDSTLTGGDRVGISSWSSSLLATVNSMSPHGATRRASEIVQAIGGVGHPRVQVQANHLADQLARVTGAEPMFFPAPGIVGTAAARDALLSDRYLSELTEHWSGLTILLAGIGALEPSPLLASSGNAVDTAEAEHLRDAGAVGDVCLRFYDEEGAPVDAGLDSRVLGISRQALLAIPRRVGVAGGHRKHAAIRGAILGGWINVLITDRDTAMSLVKSTDL
jgi:DNA-binding transcriptional regulator LsrR (DeoR family)